MMKTLVKCMTKTAEDSVKEATKRKQDQHILLKMQDSDLAVREAHYHATCRRNYTKTIEEQASNKTIYFQYIVQYVMGRIV